MQYVYKVKGITEIKISSSLSIKKAFENEIKASSSEEMLNKCSIIEIEKYTEEHPTALIGLEITDIEITEIINTIKEQIKRELEEKGN